jgi:hypothetical protein
MLLEVWTVWSSLTAHTRGPEDGPDMELVIWILTRLHERLVQEAAQPQTSQPSPEEQHDCVARLQT